MKQIATFVLLVVTAGASTGCFVRERHPRTVVVKEKRGCGPAYHWEGGACVHNGKAKGHYK